MRKKHIILIISFIVIFCLMTIFIFKCSTNNQDIEQNLSHEASTVAKSDNTNQTDTDHQVSITYNNQGGTEPSNDSTDELVFSTVEGLSFDDSTPMLFDESNMLYYKWRENQTSDFYLVDLEDKSKKITSLGRIKEHSINSGVAAFLNDKYYFHLGDTVKSYLYEYDSINQKINRIYESLGIHSLNKAFVFDGYIVSPVYEYDDFGNPKAWLQFYSPEDSTFKEYSKKDRIPYEISFQANRLMVFSQNLNEEFFLTFLDQELNEVEEVQLNHYPDSFEMPPPFSKVAWWDNYVAISNWNKQLIIYDISKMPAELILNDQSIWIATRPDGNFSNIFYSTESNEMYTFDSNSRSLKPQKNNLPNTACITYMQQNERNTYVFYFQDTKFKLALCRTENITNRKEAK